MQLERYAFNKVAQVIRTTDDFGIWCRRSTSYGHGPSVGMIRSRERFPLFLRQDHSGVPINYRPVNTNTLHNTTHLLTYFYKCIFGRGPTYSDADAFCTGHDFVAWGVTVRGKSRSGRRRRRRRTAGRCGSDSAPPRLYPRHLFSTTHNTFNPTLSTGWFSLRSTTVRAIYLCKYY